MFSSCYFPLPARVLPLVCLFTGLSLVLPLVAQEQAAPELTPLEQGRKLLGKRDFSAAEQVLREFVARNPAAEDAAEASLLHGRSLVGLDRLDDARRSFEWLLSRHPASPHAAAALEGIMQFHEQRRNATGVQEARRRLLSEHLESPVTARVWLPLANQAFEKSDFAQAATIYTALESGLDAASRKQLEAARILADGGADPERLVDIATETLFANNPVTARLLLEHFIDKHPRHARINEARTRLGWALFQGGDEESYTQAEHLWTQVAGAEPQGEWGGKSRWHLAQLQAGPRGEWEKSITTLERIVKDFPVGTRRHEQALYTRAWLFWAQRQWPEAIEAFEDLITAYPQKRDHPAITRYIEQATAMANR